VHWPADHPVHTDPRLAKWRGDADAVCPGGQVIELLRYVRSRRATTLVGTPDGPAVLKVFGSPRARANHRRLLLLRSATGLLVPRPLAVGPAGHAGLLEYVPGRLLRMLSGAEFVAGCEELGRLLAWLHASDVLLDRTWTARTEIDELARRFTSGQGRWLPPPPDTLVPAHRDLHHGQVVVAGGMVRLIDLDEAAMAPAGLDVANFLAHLTKDLVQGRRPVTETESAGAAFLRGYGRIPPDLPWWRHIALVRLACRAEERHGRPDWAARLRALAADPRALAS
jgi:aminoglycoside phosphotransferase (APT) family kinase protein